MGLNKIILPGICVAILLFGGCANIKTIGRSSYFPAISSTAKVDSTQRGFFASIQKGKAIHLDAQQRLMMVNSLGEYCAEPSPDAMAAYAASLGLGVSKPGSGSASLNQALQSSAASIGLRTQSITLMRDSLYRLCEAYANGAVNDTQAAILLAKNQDLSAVIVAVEQLTGAVVANQAALTSNTGGNSTASLLSNQKLLEQTNQEIEKLDSEIEQLKEEQAAKEKEQSAITVEDGKKEDDPVYQKKEKEIKEIKAKIKNKESDIDRYRKILTHIQQQQDSTLTSASVNNSSAVEYSNPVKTLADAVDSVAIAKISSAVENMVKEALNTDYTKAMCMSLITTYNNPRVKGGNYYYSEAAITKCLGKLFDIKPEDIESSLTSETWKNIVKKIGDPKFEAEVKEIMQKNGIQIPLVRILNETKFHDERKVIIDKLREAKKI